MYATATGYRAMAKFRDHDGTVRPVERHGPTKASAKSSLKEALRDRRLAGAGEEITPDTTLAHLAQRYLDGVRAEVAAGEKSPGTGELYETTRKRVVAAIGGLRLSEVTVGRVDKLVVAISEHHGPTSAKRTKSVLSGMFGLAARHDAIASNLVRDASRIKVGQRRTAVALSADQVAEMRAKLAADEKARAWDLLDFVDTMLATGQRIGETSAVTWDALDLEAGTVEIRGTVIRIKGVGLVLKSKPKSKAGFRKLQLPGWAVGMLRRRRSEVVANPVADARGNTWNVVFTSPSGMLRDPSNTQADLRDVFDRIGYPQVTSHVFRKTAATTMDEAGLTARQIAGQVGQSQPSMTMDVYMGRKIASPLAAEALESLGRGSTTEAATEEGAA